MEYLEYINYMIITILALLLIMIHQNDKLILVQKSNKSLEKNLINLGLANIKTITTD